MLKKNDDYNLLLMRLTLIDLIMVMAFGMKLLPCLMVLIPRSLKAYKIKNNDQSLLNIF